MTADDLERRLREEGEIARLRAENEALKRAAVIAVLPLEALLLVGNVREQHSPELWEGIEEGAQAVRTALCAAALRARAEGEGNAG